MNAQLVQRPEPEVLLLGGALMSAIDLAKIELSIISCYLLKRRPVLWCSLLAQLGRKLYLG